MKNTNINFYSTLGQPFSSDPIDYDYFGHHLVYESVLGKLVTKYSTDGYTGELAESWSQSDNFQTWEFILRKDLKFENGDVITGNHIIDSLKRVLIHSNKAQNTDNVLSYIQGSKEVSKLSDDLEGLTFKEDKLTFKFTKPMKNLLGLISFGIYGIVHPSDFDAASGKWLSGKKVISSSMYKINEVSDEKVTLQLREDFMASDFGHDKKVSEINIYFDESYKQEMNVKFDMQTSTSLASPISNDLKYIGGVTNGILYLRCQSWSHKDSPFFQIENRIKMRDTLFSKLANSLEVTTSFFPKSINGVQEVVTSPPQANSSSWPAKVRFQGFSAKHFNIVRDIDNIINNKNKVFEKVEQVKLPSRTIGMEFAPNLDKYSLDMIGIQTGIHIDSPEEDVIFMFKSKSGIRLPDTDGSITPLLEEGKVIANLQKINEKLWEQAVIWPIAHFSRGFAVSENIDSSSIKIENPTVNFAWIGSK